MRVWARGIRAGAVLTAALVCGVPAGARPGEGRPALFDKLAGSWSGVGTARVASGPPEPMRCRAAYSPADPSHLRLTLRCASDSFNLQVESDITRQGDRIAGTWTETSVGVTGDLSGTVDADHLRATIAAMGTSAVLSLAVRGGVQSVTLTSQGQLAGSAVVTLRRG